MSEILVTQNLQITDPEVLAIGRRVVGEMFLSAEKAAAHIADPAAFPIAADAELEKLFLERLRTMPSEKQKRAGEKALEFLRGPAAARAGIVGALADVDVSGPRSVSEIVRERPVPALKISSEGLKKAFAHGAPAAKAPQKAVRPSDANEWLELRLHHVKCVDETDGFLGSEAGSDEMSMSVLFVDPIQNTAKSPVADLGSYASDGAERPFSPPLVLGGWDLRVGFFWPRTITAMVYLSEIDNGGFPEWMQKALEFAKSKLAAAVTSAVGAAIGAAIGSLIGAGVGALVGALVGWVVGELISALKTWWEDDVFECGTLTVNIDSPGATFSGSTTSPQFQFHYRGHGGEYVLTADVRLTTRPTGQSRAGLVTSRVEDYVTDISGVACCLSVEPASDTKIIDPITKQVTTLPTMKISIEKPLVFAVGRSDGSMMFRDLSKTDGAWTSLGGAFRSGPAVALTGPTRPVVFARGTDDALWHTWRDSSKVLWAGWHSLGGQFTSAPAAAMTGNRLVVAARGTDGAIWHKWYDNGWSGWHSLGGQLSSGPAMVQSGNRLVVAARGMDGAIWHKWYENGWSGWHSLGGQLTSGPAMMISNEGRLVVFARGTDGAIWHKWYENGWSGWHTLGGVLHSGPAAMLGASKEGMVIGRGTDGALYERHYSGGWTPWTSLGTP
jgi:hypothetical protein